MEAITTPRRLREFFPSGVADSLNLFITTEAMALVEDGQEVDESARIAYADALQVEGFILQPRKARAIPFELVLHNGEDVDFVLGLIRTTQGPLAERQSAGVQFASQRLPGLAGIEEPIPLTGLGEMKEALAEEARS